MSDELLECAGTWRGDDFEECLTAAIDSRGVIPMDKDVLRTRIAILERENAELRKVGVNRRLEQENAGLRGQLRERYARFAALEVVGLEMRKAQQAFEAAIRQNVTTLEYEPLLLPMLDAESRFDALLDSGKLTEPEADHVADASKMVPYRPELNPDIEASYERVGDTVTVRASIPIPAPLSKCCNAPSNTFSHTDEKGNVEDWPLVLCTQCGNWSEPADVSTPSTHPAELVDETPEREP